MKKQYILIAILFYCTAFLSAQKIAYVKNSNSAWAGRENVYTDIKLALTSNCDEVWVERGSYDINSDIVINDKIKRILGGFDGKETNSNDRSLHNETVFDIVAIVNITFGANQEFDGFTFRNRKTANNEICYIHGGNNTKFSHLTFRDHPSLRPQLITNGSIIEFCDFQGSKLNNLLVIATDTKIASCTFQNYLYKYGAPVQVSGSDEVGVVEGKSAKSLVVNCYFYNCDGLQGGALSAEKTIISSCTFIGNRARKSGGAIFIVGSVTVENCFFDNNMSGVVTLFPDDVFMSSYRRERNIRNNVSPISGTVNLRGSVNNKMFNSANASQTYNVYGNILGTATDIIDQGEMLCTYKVPNAKHNYEATDLNDHNRITGSKIDVGAVEFQQKRVAVTSEVIVPDFVEDKNIVLTDENIQLSASKEWVWVENDNQVTFSVQTSPQFKFKHWYAKEYHEILSTEQLFHYGMANNLMYDSLNVVAVLDIDHYGVKIVPNLPSGGTFTASQPRIYWGQELTLAADVKPGYQFKDWRFNGVSVGNTATNTFLAKPNLLFGGTDTLIYEAVLVRDTCNVSVRMEPEFAGNITKPEIFLYDSLVTLTATSAPHFRILKWTVDGDSVANGETYQFLPQGSAEIVVYADSIYYQIDGEISDPTLAEKVELRGVNRSYSSGSQVAIEAVLPVGVQFNHWNAYKNGSASPLRWAENPHIFSVDGNYRIVADIQRNAYEVTVGALPELSAEVVADKTEYFYGDTATITATFADGYMLDDWRICTNGWTGYSCAESYSWAASTQVGQTAVLKLPITDNVIVYANQKVGSIDDSERDTCNVSVRMEPEIAGNIIKPEWFFVDTLATLTATPAPHFRILKWTVDGDSVANSETYQFLPQGDAEIVVYADSIYYQIDGEVSDPTLAEKVELRGVNRSYSSGSQVTIETVLPVGVQFNHWDAYKNGSASPLRWAENPHTFSADGNYRIVADIQRNAYDVTVGALPELSAEVVADKTEYFYGDTATITATIAGGYMLDDWRICTNGWTGNSCAESYSLATNDAVLKLEITDNVVVYANQKFDETTANAAVGNENGIAILQIAENQLLVSLNSVEKPWQLQIFNLCGQLLQTLQVAENEIILTLPSKNFYLFKFTQNEKMLVEKVLF